MTETIKTYPDGLRVDRVTVPTWHSHRQVMEQLTHYQLTGPDGLPLLKGLFPTQAEAEAHAEWLRNQ